MTERDAAQSRPRAVSEHRAYLEIGPRFETNDAHPRAKLARPRTGSIRVVTSHVGALPIKRSLPNDGATLMDFDLPHWLANSQDPSGELDIVDIATADAWRINGKRVNLVGLGRTDFDVVDFD
jgi:hypothetical protein